MTAVLLVAHHERHEAAALARAAADWLVARGHQPWMTRDDATALAMDDLAADTDPADAGLAVCMGGDGTMLRTVHLLRGAPVPVIGVNVGLLGYLTEVEPPALAHALERFFSGEVEGDWSIDERMLLDLTVRSTGVEPRTWTALNEGVVEKLESGHTVRLQVTIDGAPFTSYAADGLILATPTGSTAYSMSARGPVVSPRTRAVLLTPVSPHMMFDRTLVLDPSEQVEVEVMGHRHVALSVDGQPAATLTEGDRVDVAASEHVARFVRFGQRRFHQILKAKFGLADR
ncbi:MAG: NAD(+)/NADH kinase [Ilumatobacteraceae bacterium]